MKYPIKLVFKFFQVDLSIFTIVAGRSSRVPLQIVVGLNFLLSHGNVSNTLFGVAAGLHVISRSFHNFLLEKFDLLLEHLTLIYLLLVHAVWIIINC